MMVLDVEEGEVIGMGHTVCDVAIADVPLRNPPWDSNPHL